MSRNLFMRFVTCKFKIKSVSSTISLLQINCLIRHHQPTPSLMYVYQLNVSILHIYLTYLSRSIYRVMNKIVRVLLKKSLCYININYGLRFYISSLFLAPKDSPNKLPINCNVILLMNPGNQWKNLIGMVHHCAAMLY